MSSTGLIMYKNKEYYYEIIKSEIFLEDYGNVTVYGIKSYNEDGSEFNIIEDISVDFESVKKLCKLICDENVSPIHLIDIAEDFIISESSYL